MLSDFAREAFLQKLLLLQVAAAIHYILDQLLVELHLNFDQT